MEEVCSALPAELQAIKDSLDRDTVDLRRREAGAEDFTCLHLHEPCFERAQMLDSAHLHVPRADHSAILQPWQTRSPSRTPSCGP